MNNNEWKNYPYDADSPYQRNRKRFKTLVTLISGSGHIVERRIYEINQDFNRWEKTDVTKWDYKPIQKFSNRLQKVLDHTMDELSKLENEIKKQIAKDK